MASGVRRNRVRCKWRRQATSGSARWTGSRKLAIRPHEHRPLPARTRRPRPRRHPEPSRSEERAQPRHARGHVPRLAPCSTTIPSCASPILTGTGDVFCAGADLKAMGAGETDDEFMQLMSEVPDIHWQALLRHNRPTKPIIAAVEGFAVAGGTEILQGTDIRVAAEDAIFGVTEARRGLFPLGGSSVRLRRQIPYTLAAEILLTGRHVTARGGARLRARRPARAEGPGARRGDEDRRRRRDERAALDPRAHAHAARGRRELLRGRRRSRGSSRSAARSSARATRARA